MSSIEKEFRVIADVSFREIAGQVLYIECKDILEKMKQTEAIEPSMTGLIVYAYIDHSGGLSCWPALIAALAGDSLQVFDLADSNTKYIFRINEEYKEYSEELGDRKLWMCHITPDHRFCNAELFGTLAEEIRPFGDFIDKQYGMDNPDRKVFRDNREWDHLRNQYWPDDFQVLLTADGLNGEVVWVRSEFQAKDEYAGELLNEPYQDFGIHQGNVIGFREHVLNDGDLILYSTLNVWERQDLN